MNGGIFPDYLKIGGKYYKLTFVDFIEENKKSLGILRQHISLIEVKNNRNRYDTLETILHEILHCLDFQCNRSFFNNEEKVSLLTFLLHNFLLQNPGLLKLLLFENLHDNTFLDKIPRNLNQLHNTFEVIINENQNRHSFEIYGENEIYIPLFIEKSKYEQDLNLKTELIEFLIAELILYCCFQEELTYILDEEKQNLLAYYVQTFLLDNQDILRMYIEESKNFDINEII